MNKQKLPNKTLFELLRIDVWLQWLFLCLGAACVGGSAALFWAISGLAHRLLSMMINFSPYLPLVVTPLSFASISAFTNKFFRPALGSGVPQTMAAFAAHEATYPKKLLSLPIAVAKLILTALGQACGGSVGQEGPMVQIGASVMYFFERFIPPGTISRQELNRMLIASGSAAGVAGAFNAPLGGVMFALELIVKAIKVRMSAAIVVSVIVAAAAAQYFYGDYSYFGRTSVEIDSYVGWGVAVLCGVVGGVVGGFFSRGLLPASFLCPPFLLRFRQSSPVLFAGLCGFCVALIGVLLGGTTFGNGAHETQLLLEHVDSLPVMYSVGKLLTTFLSTFSAIPAGLFAPSLSVGAGIGANISMLVPSVPSEAVILLGIAAFFSGVFQAPLTSAVIVMEMAGDYSMAMPLMLTALIASAISKPICKPSFYDIMMVRWLEPKTIEMKPIPGKKHDKKTEPAERV